MSRYLSPSLIHTITYFEDPDKIIISSRSHDINDPYIIQDVNGTKREITQLIHIHQKEIDWILASVQDRRKFSKKYKGWTPELKQKSKFADL